MQKNIRVFGRSVPLWLPAVVLVAIVGVAVAAGLIGTVRMPWKVVPPPPTPTASMTPDEVELPIGTLHFGESKTFEPTKVATLTVENGAVDLIFELGGDYGGFDKISITVQLRQGENVIHEAVITPTIVVSSVLHPSPTGTGGWSDKEASKQGYVETCFVRVLEGEGDLAQLVKWVPGATITIGDETYTYPETPFGYTYDEGETGYVFQNDDDAGDSIQLVLVYPSTTATIEDVAPGEYDVYVGFTVTAGNAPSSGEAALTVSYSS